LTALAREGLLLNRYYPVHTPSGEIRIVNFTTRPLQDARGEIFQRQATFRDVTEQFETLDRLHQRVQEHAALNTIASILNRPLEIEHSLDQVCAQIATVTGMETTVIYLLNESARKLDLAAQRGVSPQLLAQVRQLGLDDLAVSTILSGGKTVALNDVTEFPSDASLAGPRAEGYRAGIGVPILRRGKPTGAIYVGSKIKTRYEQAQVDWLQNVANQLGIALENADLYARMQRRVRELDGLARISTALVANLDPRAVAQVAVEATQKLLGVDVVDLSLLREGKLYRMAAQINHSGVPLTAPIALGELVVPLVERREPLIVRDLAQATAPALARELMSPRGLRSLLVVPLVTREQVIGMLAVVHSQPRAWTAQEQELLQTIANQVASAIDSAQLYQNTLTEQRKVQAIFDSGLSGLFATDAAGRIVMFNRAAERITGWTLAEVVGKSWKELLSDHAVANPVESLMEQALQHKQIAYAFEGRKMRTKDGREIPVAKATAPLLDEKENVIGAVGAFWDLSKEQRAEIEYENFLAMVAHQLRSPLTAVLSALELFERRNLSEDRRAELWTIIKTEGNQLKRLADQFLEHQAAAKSEQPIHLEPLSVVAIARRLVRQFQVAQSTHRFQLKPSRPYPMVSADSNGLEQVLRNLLDNAVSYSPAGSLVTLQIESQDEDWVDVAVQDQGAGIPAVEHHQIFQPFYRVPQTSARRVYGHGLGLALAKEMVDAMGGRIWVESEPEHGATFHFTLRKTQ
jgi:PAS domain S-box-containing protein